MDEYFLVPPKSALDAIYKQVLMNADEFSFEELLDLANEMKREGCIASAYSAIIRLFDNISQAPDRMSAIRTLVPMRTSCLRGLNRPQEAVEVFENAMRAYGKSCLSSALYNSVAAAYCDLGQFDKARSYANRAYAMQGGGRGEQNELSLVYKRIEKETR